MNLRSLPGTFSPYPWQQIPQFHRLNLSCLILMPCYTPQSWLVGLRALHWTELWLQVSSLKIANNKITHKTTLCKRCLVSGQKFNFGQDCRCMTKKYVTVTWLLQLVSRSAFSKSTLPHYKLCISLFVSEDTLVIMYNLFVQLEKMVERHVTRKVVTSNRA